MMKLLIVKLANGQAVAHGNVYSSLSIAHWCLTKAYGEIDPTVRMASVIEGAHWKRSLINRTATLVSAFQPEVTGFFVDWDGETRRFESPGDGYRCAYVYTTYPSVEVIDSSGCVIFEGAFHPTLESIRKSKDSVSINPV